MLRELSCSTRRSYPYNCFGDCLLCVRTAAAAAAALEEKWQKQNDKKRKPES